MPLSLISSLLAALCALGGCTNDSPARARLLVSFITESDPGEPLPGVSVAVDAAPVASSAPNGLIQTVLTGRPGQKLAVHYDCPPGHRPEREAPGLQLPDRPRPGSEVGSLEMTLRCPPVLRTVAIAVRAGAGVGLPVLLDGKRVTQTDAAGVAHLRTEAKPGTELSVQLDTSKRPDLRPQSPARHFVVPDRREAFVLTQSFHRVVKRKRSPPKPFRIIKIE